MSQPRIWALWAICFIVGTSVGLWAKGSSGGGIAVMRGKPPKEAGRAALAEAEKLAGKGSWERIGVGRVYYLSGDKAKGQALFDSVTNVKPQTSDWQRIGEVYAEAGETEKAEACFQKVLVDPKDDTGQSEIGSWYVRVGQREKGEELIAKALARSPDELWHYVRASEAYLGVPKGK
jgi:tetratricopeptide (TPR) repeat protein